VNARDHVESAILVEANEATISTPSKQDPMGQHNRICRILKSNPTVRNRHHNYHDQNRSNFEDIRSHDEQRQGSR
jgi:hypothetical protein